MTLAQMTLALMTLAHHEGQDATQVAVPRGAV